jgi:hypothetical protein
MNEDFAPLDAALLALACCLVVFALGVGVYVFGVGL